MTPALLLAAIGIALGSCATGSPTLKPCGVITDNLIGVEATTPAGERRLTVHYARGKAAGCWP